MNPLEEIKKKLTEVAGADEAARIVESLQAFVKKAGEDAKAEAEKGVTAKIAEGVKEAKVVLEQEYLTKLDTAREAGEKRINEELDTFKKQLAQRCKIVLENGMTSHGDRLARIAEQTEAKRGSALLEEVAGLIEKGKKEINESVKGIDPKEHAKLQSEVKRLTESVASEKKEKLAAQARANIAESQVQDLRESTETSLSVVVEDDKGTEPTKSKPAQEEHPDSSGRQPVNEDSNGGGSGSRWTPDMQRMRRRAGLPVT